MKTIGHENKKKFKVLVFQVLFDFRKGKLKPKNLEKVRRHIHIYSAIDSDFVQRTIKLYEEMFAVRMSEALKTGGLKNAE